jgi:hypothetical protein
MDSLEKNKWDFLVLSKKNVVFSGWMLLCGIVG